MPDASWRYSDSSVAPSRTRSGAERARAARRRSPTAPARPARWRRGSFTRRARAGASGSPGRLDRLAVDEHLVAGSEVVAEAHEAAVALGAQLALADLGRLAALAHGVGDAAAGAA